MFKLIQKITNVSFFSSATLLLELDDLAGMEIAYKPGDHLGVFACNRSELVEGILKHLDTSFDPDVPVELQIQKQTHTPNGYFLVIFFFFFV